MEPDNQIPIHPEIARDRQEGDIDLVAETHSRLKAANWNQADAWLEHPEIVLAKDSPPALQQLLIARNLQDPFLGLPIDTRADRLRLNATPEPADFLSEIEQHIAPRLHELEPLHAAIAAKDEQQLREVVAKLQPAPAETPASPPTDESASS